MTGRRERRLFEQGQFGGSVTRIYASNEASPDDRMAVITQTVYRMAATPVTLPRGQTFFAQRDRAIGYDELIGKVSPSSQPCWHTLRLFLFTITT